MTLEELRERRKKLEVDLATEIGSWVEGFRTDTGWSPEGIHLHFVEVTSLGDARPQYILRNVTVDLERI